MGKNLRDANHHLVMITGDHVLTATYVAIKTYIVSRKTKILICDFVEGKFKVSEVDYKNDSEVIITCDSVEEVLEQCKSFQSVAMTGGCLEKFEKGGTKLLNKIIPLVAVFARTSPQQKELIIN